MLRILSLLSFVVVFMGACAPAPSQLGADGKPRPQLYKIRDRDTDRIQFRMLDSINALRAAAGQSQLNFDAKLNAAAATHARDMSIQNRPWHFGSDGSSPIDRVNRVGFDGRLIGENISETYESELETLGAWMEQEDTRRVILSPEAARMGFSWYQESNGKIWWVLVVGSGIGTAIVPTPS